MALGIFHQKLRSYYQLTTKTKFVKTSAYLIDEIAGKKILIGFFKTNWSGGKWWWIFTDARS